MLSVNAYGQTPYYKKTEYRTTYDTYENRHHHKPKKTKVCLEYSVYDRHNNILELGEYGLQYCISGKETGGEDYSITTLYRIEDFHKLRSVSYFTYDTMNNMLSQEILDFSLSSKTDTSWAFYTYDAHNKVISLRTTEKGNTVTKQYIYDSKGHIADLTDSTGKSYWDKNTISRYDSEGQLVEDINLRNGIPYSRVEYTTDITSQSEIGYDTNNKPEYIEETYGLKGYPETVYYKDLKYNKGEIQLTVHKYDLRRRRKKSTTYKLALNTMKKKVTCIYTYKYKFL